MLNDGAFPLIEGGWPLREGQSRQDSKAEGEREGPGDGCVKSDSYWQVLSADFHPLVL